MFRVIRFGTELEPLVGFVEETLPDRIVEETVGKLRSGTDPDRMMVALALAAIRSTEMPFVHHGGPLHPVAALPAVRATMARLPANRRELPLIQDVALANAHIHDAASGPYVMPEIEPVGEGSVEATQKAFFGCLQRNYPMRQNTTFFGCWYMRLEMLHWKPWCAWRWRIIGLTSTN